MIKLPAIVLLVLLSVSPVFAEDLSLEPMFQQAAAESGVSVQLIQAIAGVESGLSPWVLNIEGKGYRFDSKEEAVRKAQEAQAKGLSFDSGLMQVNNFWLEKYGIPLEAAFDPCANIYLGSWILKQEMNRHGDTWRAVGAYHSADALKGQEYVEMVKKALAKSPMAIGKKTTRKTVKKEVQDFSPMVVSRRYSQVGIEAPNPAAKENDFVRRLK